jgi:hypothetical protein
MATVLGYNNLIESATLSGGDWETDYPLSNVQTRYHGQRARSTSTSATITVAVAGIDVVAVAGNFSQTATFQYVAGAYDSGAISASAIVLPTTEASVTITITDTSNPDGYVAVGRVFVGAAWQPALCIDWGYSLGIESRTGVAESLGGVEFFDVKRSRRTWSGKWSWLTDSEAFDGLLAIQKSHDIWREIAFILDDANPLQQNAFLGRFRQLSSVEHPYPSNYAMAVEVQEMLA